MVDMYCISNGLFSSIFLNFAMDGFSFLEYFLVFNVFLVLGLNANDCIFFIVLTMCIFIYVLALHAYNFFILLGGISVWH